jgi:FtsP/CotA-like multicopper oxidase with cupredoxin domain
MKPWVRWVAIAAGLAAVVVLFVVLNPGDDEEPPAPTATATETPTATETETTSATETQTPTETTSASPTPDAVEIEVEVEDGEVQGPGDVEVQQGDRVRLVVEADVSDEVHVHGYDLLADVSPDDPAMIVFRANAPGVFEVELEGAGLPLLELTVTP